MLTPKKIGRFDIIRQLGQGGMGSIWLGCDPGLNREAAIKIMHDASSSSEDLKRFQREAQAAAKLNHPGIVTVYEMGQEQGRFFLAMELIKGKSFSKLIRSDKVPDKTAILHNLSLFRQVLEAVAYAHENGVVHRDLKPDNIMVTDGGRIKVLDFGLAFMSGQHNLTRTGGESMGTPAYMAPEQIQDFAHTDQRADIYSLGVILHELVTGKCPFTAPKTISLIYKVIKEEPLQPSQINPIIGGKLDALVLRMLRKNPKERFQSVNELLPVYDEACTELNRGMSAVKRAGLPQAAAVKSAGSGKSPLTAVTALPAGRNNNAAETCPSCGWQNRTGYKFCNKCGSPNVYRCPSCGSGTNSQGDIFCNECGFKLGVSAISADKSAASPSAQSGAGVPSGTYQLSASAVPPVPPKSSTPSLRDVYANKLVGDCFEFGRYPQGAYAEVMPITWRVLRRDSDSLLVVAEKCLDCKPYHEKFTKITWADCSLRHWLNADFYNRAFNEQERALILQTYVINNAGPDTDDHVFLLSINEANRFFADDAARQAVPTDFTVERGVYASVGWTWWWLRSRGWIGSYAAYVSSGGGVDVNGLGVDYGCGAVRPAFKIAL